MAADYVERRDIADTHFRFFFFGCLGLLIDLGVPLVGPAAGEDCDDEAEPVADESVPPDPPAVAPAVCGMVFLTSVRSAILQRLVVMK